MRMSNEFDAAGRGVVAAPLGLRPTEGEGL
jgi:hypothetical protein